MHVPHTQTLASVLILNLFKPKLCPPGQQTVVCSCNQILSSTKEVPAPTARGSVTQRGAGEGDGKERACACARASWDVLRPTPRWNRCHPGIWGGQLSGNIVHWPWRQSYLTSHWKHMCLIVYWLQFRVGLRKICTMLFTHKFHSMYNKWVIWRFYIYKISPKPK